MQKQLSKAGKISSRSHKRVTASKSPAAKPAPTSKKRTVTKSVTRLARIRNNRLSVPPIPWENPTSVLTPVTPPAHESLTAAPDTTKTTSASSPRMPWNNRATALNTTDLTPPHTLTVPPKDTVTVTPSHSLTPWGNQTPRRRATDVAIPHASPPTSATPWKRALTASLHFPSVLLSLFGWHNTQHPMQQKRMIFQMLIVSGSVRP